MTLHAMERKPVAICLLAGMALLVIPIILLSTKYGPGVTPDSVVYLRAAQNFSNGHGVTLESGDGYQRLTHFAPLFPVIISLVSLTGLSLERSAFCLNLILFASNVFLVGWISLRMMKSSLLAALLCSFLLLTSTYVIECHAMVWSDPLMIFFGFGGIFLLSEYYQKNRWIFLLLSAVTLSLAQMTRYAGFAFVLAAVCSLLLIKKNPWRRRLLDALLLGCIASLPLIVWMGGLPIAGASRVHEIVPHYVRSDDLNFALYSISLWLVPEGIPGIYKQLALAAFLAGVTFLFYRFWTMNEKRTEFLSFSFFIVSYFALLAFTISFVRYNVSGDPRIYTPVLMASLILVVVLFDVSWALRSVRIAGTVFILILSLSYVLRAGIWIEEAHTKGLGYNSPAWQQSEILKHVRNLPIDTRIYTNNTEVLHFLLGRSSFLLPKKEDKITVRSNPGYLESVDHMRTSMREEGVIVFFYGSQLMTELPTIGELKRMMPLEAVASTGDGVILRWRKASATF